MWSVLPALGFSSQVSALPILHFFFQRIYMCLCRVVVTVFAVGGESVCRGQKGFQAEREVADQNTYVGSRGAFGGTFARFVLDQAVGSCCHQYD